MGVVTGKPLSSKGLETSVYCLTNNQPSPSANFQKAVFGQLR